MRSSLPPYPSGSSWKAWATQLFEFLSAKEKIEAENLPEPVQLPHIKGGEKALEDGLLMFNPTTGRPTFTSGGTWVDL